jgi:hypothetical protein
VTPARCIVDCLKRGLLGFLHSLALDEELVALFVD